MTVIRGPPVLRIRHQHVKILDDRIQIERLELFRVVEVRLQRIREHGVLMEDCEIQTLGPPFSILYDPARIVCDSAVHG